MDSSDIPAPREVSGSGLCQPVDYFPPWYIHTCCQPVSGYNKLTQPKVVKATVKVLQDPISWMSPVFLTHFKQTWQIIHLSGQSGPQKCYHWTKCNWVSKGNYVSMIAFISYFIILTKSTSDLWAMLMLPLLRMHYTTSCRWEDLS